MMDYDEIKRRYHEDDNFAWIVFLVLLNPVPFFYSALVDAGVEASAIGLTVGAFALNIVFWLLLGFLAEKFGLLGMGNGGGKGVEK